MVKPARRSSIPPPYLAMIDAFRAGIARCGRADYELAQAAGISRSVVSAFMTGKRGITFETFCKLAHVLGWAIVDTGKPRRGRRAASSGARAGQRYAPARPAHGAERTADAGAGLDAPENTSD